MTDRITPTFSGEALLRRWSESSTQGVQVTFALSDSAELEPLKAKTGKRFMAVLVEIGDDEQPVAGNPASPETGNSASGKPRERLGDLAWRAVQWCKEPEFINFLNTLEPGIDSEFDAAAYIRRVCRASSRKDLDTNPGCKQLFNALIRGPYQKHLMARGIKR